MSKELTEYYNKDLKLNCGASYDVAGVDGNPADAITFWNEVGSGEIKFGLEAIGFKSHTQKVIDLSKNADLPTPLIGIHTKMGLDYKLSSQSLFTNLKRHLLDPLIISPHVGVEVADSFQRPVYVLAHDVALKNVSYLHRINNAVDQTRYVTLVAENDTMIGSTKNAIKISQTKPETSELCFDVLHFAKEEGLDWASEYMKIINTILDTEPTLVHIPIGYCNNYALDDSIPYNIPDGFYKQLGIARKVTKFFPIFECQWGLTEGSLYGISRNSWNKKVNFIRSRLTPFIKHRVIEI